MTIVSPQISFNYLSAVIVSVTLGALFALLVCGLICVCRILHSSPTFECENIKMRQEGVRSCPDDVHNEVILSLPTDRSMPVITLTAASIRRKEF
uniref:Uncharacterized protein n=1 Tax=Panagrolaimus sp. ES5 TaxID=591445 RepID=A0AC34GL19_9BILA